MSKTRRHLLATSHTWVLLFNVLLFVPHKYLSVTVLRFWGIPELREVSISAWVSLSVIAALMWCAGRYWRAYLIVQFIVSVLAVTVLWFSWREDFRLWMHGLPLLVLIVALGGLALVLVALSVRPTT